jgi:hypothetical protein
MTENDTTEPVQVDESTDKNNVFVVDPDDYQRTRKLKAINDAKDHVRKLRRDMPPSAKTKEWAGIHARTSEAVAMYGSELMPLIEDALDQGILEEEDLETEFGSLRTFVRFDGHLPKSDSGEKLEFQDAKSIQYMTFYRQLDRIQRKLGLGLELQEDKGPAEI